MGSRLRHERVSERCPSEQAKATVRVLDGAGLRCQTDAAMRSEGQNSRS